MNTKIDEQEELPGSLQAAIAVLEGQWPHAMDAHVWAKKWLETLARVPSIATDEATMIGWFANAIMAGYDTAQMRASRLTQAEAGGAVPDYWIAVQQNGRHEVFTSKPPHGSGIYRECEDMVPVYKNLPSVRLKQAFEFVSKQTAREQSMQREVLEERRAARTAAPPASVPAAGSDESRWSEDFETWRREHRPTIGTPPCLYDQVQTHVSRDSYFAGRRAQANASSPSQAKVDEPVRCSECGEIADYSTLVCDGCLRKKPSNHFDDEPLRGVPEARDLKLWCEMCEGRGVFDATLGSDSRVASINQECPDCEGKGYWKKVTSEPEQRVVEWQPIETYKGEWPIRIRAPELVNEFNEVGETDACAECGDYWSAAQWDNSQDYFKTIVVTPTHWLNTYALHTAAPDTSAAIKDSSITDLSKKPENVDTSGPYVDGVGTSAADARGGCGMSENDPITCSQAVRALKAYRNSAPAKAIASFLGRDSRAVATALRGATKDGRVVIHYRKGIAWYRFKRLTPRRSATLSGTGDGK